MAIGHCQKYHHYSQEWLTPWLSRKIFKIQEDYAFTEAGMLKIVQKCHSRWKFFLVVSFLIFIHLWSHKLIWPLALDQYTNHRPSLCISHTKPNQCSDLATHSAWVFVILPLHSLIDFIPYQSMMDLFSEWWSESQDGISWRSLAAGHQWPPPHETGWVSGQAVWERRVWWRVGEQLPGGEMAELDQAGDGGGAWVWQETLRHHLQQVGIARCLPLLCFKTEAGLHWNILDQTIKFLHLWPRKPPKKDT